MKLLHLFFIPIAIFLFVSPLFAAIRETRQVSGFNAISVSGPFNTTVEISGKEGVVIDADLDDRNVTDSITVVVEKRALRIYFEWPYSWDVGAFAGLIRITISATDQIASLVNAGSGPMTVTGPLTFRSISVASQGSGNMDIQNLQTENFQAVTNGAGNMRVKGRTINASFSNTGAGSIDALAVEAETVAAANYGSGNILVNANAMLSAMTHGSGGVLYRGQAMVSAQQLGLGEIRSLNPSNV